MQINFKNVESMCKITIYLYPLKLYTVSTPVRGCINKSFDSRRGSLRTMAIFNSQISTQIIHLFSQKLSAVINHFIANLNGIKIVVL